MYLLYDKILLFGTKVIKIFIFMGSKQMKKGTKKTTGVNNKKGKQTQPNPALKIFGICLMVLLSVFMFYPPFLRGLYFEENQLPAEIFVFILFIIFSIYKLVRKDRRFLQTPLDYAGLALVVLYFLSVLFYIVGIRIAVAPRTAVLEWLKYCMYFAVFFMISDLAASFKSKLAFVWVIIGSAVCVSLLSFDAATGGNIISGVNFFIKHFTQVIKPEDVFLSNRLYSTIQYPNAFGSYLLAVLFLSVTLTVISSRLWVKAIGGACSFIFIISLIFTQSRGVMIIGLIPVLIFILALTKETRIRAISLGLAVIVSAGLITTKLWGYMMAPTGNEAKIWLLLLLGVVLSAGLTLLFNYLSRWMEKVNWKIYIGALAAVIVVGVIAAVVVINSTTKLTISHSESEPDSPVTILRSTVIEPGKDYKLVFDVDAKMNGKKPDAYSVIINYKRERDIIVNEREVPLISYDGKQTIGTEKKEIPFKLPSDSKVVNIYFRNTFQGTGVTFDNARIVDAASGNTIKNIALKHKYISDSTIDKYSNMFQSRSFVERTIFYKDGLQVWKNHWLIGAGGGAWLNSYLSNQSFAYKSTQVHSYLLQIALECGILGVIALLFLILSVILLFLSEYKYRRNTDSGERVLQAALIAGIAGLILHSFFDFDFSLSAVFLLFWQMLGIFNARYRNSNAEEIVENRKPLINKILSATGRIVNIKKLNTPAVVIMTVSLVLLFMPIFINTAKGYAEEAIKLSSSNIDSSLEKMQKAAQTDPYMLQYKIDCVKLLLAKQQKTQKDIEDIKDYLKSAEKLSWYNDDLIARVGEQYFKSGDLDNGLEMFDRAVELRPLWVEQWQQRIGAYYNVAEYYINEGKKDKAESYINKIKDVQDEAIKANKKNMNPFIFNTATDEKLEKLLYAKDKLNSVNKSELEKLVFYNIPAMDVDFDGLPDQWTASSNISLNVSDNKKAMTAENKNNAGDSYIQSRQLTLTAGKKYKIEAQLKGNSGVAAIPFDITGINQPGAVLKQSGTDYAAEFSTPADFKPSDNRLRIFLTDKYEITSIIITEV